MKKFQIRPLTKKTLVSETREFFILFLAQAGLEFFLWDERAEVVVVLLRLGLPDPMRFRLHNKKEGTAWESHCVCVGTVCVWEESVSVHFTVSC